jgi:hypothetical protein
MLPARAQHPAAKPNPVLKNLEVLIGEWNTAGTHPAFPGATLRGHVSFEWFEGGAFLTMYSIVEEPGPPSSITVFGRDDATETYSMQYFDIRGVSRIYAMSLEGRICKLWRNAPGFAQRFTGTFSEDGNAIVGRWDKSGDGVNWEKDLELTYTRDEHGL